MEITRLRLNGALVIKPHVYRDERGSFCETFSEKRFTSCRFCQDNESISKRGVLRGMHFQKGQAKLVRVVSGEIYDVIVDIRPDSSTFRQWLGVTLTPDSQLFVPDGFAHGFVTLSEQAIVNYKVSTFYDPQAESGFAYNDPTIGIQWPVSDPLLSQRDRQAATFFESVS